MRSAYGLNSLQSAEVARVFFNGTQYFSHKQLLSSRSLSCPTECEGLCRAHWSFEMLGGSSPRVVPIINRLPLQHPTEDCYTFASTLRKK